MLGSPLLAGALLVAVCVVTGCRVNTDDLRRWEKTQNGPDKLVAVLIHDKYEKELRVEAAWSLVDMKRRGGQPVGLNRLIEELQKMSASERREILEGLWKKLGPKVVVPLEKAGDGKVADPAVSFKDATFALFNEEKLEMDGKLRTSMASALAEWALGKEGDAPDKRLENFEKKMDNSGQAYGLEQILRKLGTSASTRLPALLKAAPAVKSVKLDAIARITVDVKPTGGDKKAAEAYDKARDELSANFAELLKATLGDGYTKGVEDEVKATLGGNPQGKTVLADPKLFATYMNKVRDDRLNYMFPIAKLAGRKAVVDVLVALASDGKAQKEHRALALAALEGNVDTTSDDSLKAFLAIAKSDAPDEVKHGALLRISNYPPEKAIKTFYELFDAPNWKVRFDGAMSVLALMQKAGTKSGTTVKEFLGKLPRGLGGPEAPPIPGKETGGNKMGLGEPSSYGQAFTLLPKDMGVDAAIADILTGNPTDRKPIGPLLTAFGYYYATGKPSDLPMLAKWETDKQPVPKCKEDDECNWEKPGCPVPKNPAKPDDGYDNKSIATVGDYVTYCVKPEIERRAKLPAAPETK
ncbi:MAG: hypothetical protein JNL79_31310 [Myxococcales bacterium]|nr:hypothetical protein [Myxococcales bacterium]